MKARFPLLELQLWCESANQECWGSATVEVTQQWWNFLGRLDEVGDHTQVKHWSCLSDRYSESKLEQKTSSAGKLLVLMDHHGDGKRPTF